MPAALQRPAEDAVFERALRFTLSCEGGFCDEPGDSGGPTKFGITQKSWDEYRQGLPPHSVRDLTPTHARAFYLHRWRLAHCPEMPSRLAMLHFDTSTLHGIGGATKILQRTLGIKADGIFGPQTAGALHAIHIGWVGDDELLIRRYLRRRGAEYVRLLLRGKAKFFNGWVSRLRQIKRELRKEGSCR